MGRKILLVFSYIFLILLLVGCGNVSDEKNNPDNMEVGPYKYFPPVRDVFEMAKNVYEAELVELKENKNEYSQTVAPDIQGNFKIKVRIKFVYKGDYFPSENIVEDTVFLHYTDCVNIGSTYLFMTGIDEDYIESDKNKHNNKLNLYNYSKFHAIEILEDGKFNAVLTKSGYTGDKKYSTYYEILYDMLDLEDLVGLYAYFFWEHIPHTKDNSDKDIFKAMCDSADNIYIGDVVEIQDDGWSYVILGENEEGYTCPITKIKIKVSLVLRGEYVPGQIIEDIIPVESSAPKIYSNNLLCISGDDYFAYYKEMLSGEKTMEDVSRLFSS